MVSAERPFISLSFPTVLSHWKLYPTGGSGRNSQSVGVKVPLKTPKLSNVTFKSRVKFVLFVHKAAQMSSRLCVDMLNETNFLGRRTQR